MSGRFLGLENRTSAYGPDPLPWLRVFPPNVTFGNVEANTTYTATVTLRNADNRPHVVKVIPPKTGRFSLRGEHNGVTSTRLSPGLTTTFEVDFTSDEQDDFFDTCVIQTDAGSTSVDLVARAPVPSTSISGDFDFGIVSPGDVKQKRVLLRNVGTLEACIETKWDRRVDGDTFSVEPRFATIKPGDSIELTANLTPKEPGDVDVTVDVFVTNSFGDDDGFPKAQNTKDSKRLHATATVVPRAPEFLSDDPFGVQEPLPLSTIDFGYVLCGDAREIFSSVYNNSPYDSKFKVKLVGESDKKDAKLLIVTPDRGTLAPYEKRRLTFRIAPPLQQVVTTKGFKTGRFETSDGPQSSSDDTSRDIKLVANISFDSNLVKPFKIPVTARAVVAGLSLDPPVLDFGSIEYNDAGDHLVTVRNLNDETPIDFSFGRSAYFKPTPSRGKVLPGQTVTVSVAYEPKGLGAHTSSLTVQALGTSTVDGKKWDARIVANQDEVVVFTTELQCTGRCREGALKAKPTRGLTATPNDFQRQKKYVNPAEVVAQTETIRLKKATQRAHTKDSTNALSIYAERGDMDPSKHALTLDQASRKLEHKSAYDSYIKDSRLNRIAGVAKKLDDPNDPTTLGLRNQYDLKNTQGGVYSLKHDLGPALPRADEPLWLDPSKQKGCEDEEQKRRRKSRRAAKIPFSYLRPRNRPQQAVEAETSVSAGGARTDAPQEPETAAQKRDCARVLIPDEISKLSAGPSNLNFGSVAGGSTHVKYFAFTNGTSKSVLCRLEIRRGSSVFSEATTRFSSVSEFVPESELSNDCGVLTLSSTGEGVATRVVEPGDTVHFPVHFEALNGVSELKTTFKEQIGYTVNDNPQQLFSFDAIAEVIPACLDLSTEQLLFKFSKHDDDNFTVTETIKISNPNDDPASFAWDVPSKSKCAFVLQPTEGEVPGKQSHYITVTWTPSDNNEHNECTLPMFVVGDATPRTLRCVGELGSPAIVFADKILKFGPVCAGFHAKQTISIRNTTRHDAVFVVADRHESKLEDAYDINDTRVTCEPRRGRVHAGSTFDIDVMYVNPSPGKHRSNLVLHVRGGKTVSLPVSIDAIVPVVQVVEHSLDFGDVFVGITRKISATLRNDSKVFASLVCDARSIPELKLSVSSENWSPEEYDDPPVQQIPRYSQAVLGLLGNSVVNKLVRAGSKIAAARRGWGDDRGGDRFKINVAPNSELTVDIEYLPRKGFQHTQFYLPLYREGIPMDDGRFSHEDLLEAEAAAAALAVPVGISASEPRVRLSTTSINFGERVVLREGFRKVAHVVEFVLSHNGQEGSDGDESIPWRLGTPSDDIFSFSPSSGMMKKNQSQKVVCTFAPFEPTTYRSKVPLFLDKLAEDTHRLSLSSTSSHTPVRMGSFSLDNTTPSRRISGITGMPRKSSAPSLSATTKNQLRGSYLSFEVFGEGVFPRLDFDTREVVLPPTPLGITTTQRFHIINKGYANEKVTHVLPKDNEKIAITVSYPEGDHIGEFKPSLPVDVSFVASSPISFTAAIDFLDQEGNRFCVPVSGVVDNSALTLEAFTEVNNLHGAMDKALKVGNVSKTGKGKNDATEVDPVFENFVAPVVLSKGSLLKTPTEDEIEQSAEDCQALARWMEVTTPFGPFKNLAHSMRSRGGKTFVDLVEFWSGKAFIGKTLNISDDARLASRQTLRQYEALLTHLKSCGATLAGVRPEMLIDPDDFKRLTRSYQRKIENREVTHVEADRMRSWIALEVDPPARAHRERLAQVVWRATLMQTIKIFVLNRVTPRKVQVLVPKDLGLAPQEKQKLLDPREPLGLAGSNVFSVSESILLRWLTFQRRKVYGSSASRVENFGHDLKDGSVFYAAIVAHWPVAAETFETRMKLPHSFKEKSNLTTEVCHSNACVVLEALEFVRQPYGDSDLAGAVIVNASAAELVLFTLFLYQALPCLVPKTSIKFPCRLGKVTTKDVSLKNSSDSSITYTARLVGNNHATKQFHVEHTTIKIAPKGESHVRVNCSPTAAKPEEKVDKSPKKIANGFETGDENLEDIDEDGIRIPDAPTPTAACFLVLSSSKEGSASGTAGKTMVFSLEAFVDADAPVTSELFGAKLYEMRKTQIEVQNPFPADCEFVVSCHNLRRDNPRAINGFELLEGTLVGNKENAANARRSSQKDREIGVRRNATVVDQERKRDGTVVKTLSADKILPRLPKIKRSKYPGAFGAERVAARVRGNATVTIDIAFLPFALGAHVAHLVLEDVDHGKFVVELLGKADLPNPAAVIKSELEVRPQTFDVVVDHSNPPFEQARRTFLEQHPNRMDRAEAMKARVASDAWPSSIEYAAISVSSYVEIDDFVSVSRNPLWQPGQEFDPDSLAKLNHNQKPMQIGLNIRDAGTYPGVIVLGSQHDVRVLELEFTAGVKDERACLEFTAHARKMVTQDIPIVNAGGESMSVKANVQGPDAHVFIGANKDILVQKGRRDVFPLTFAPSKPGTFTAVLTLRVVKNGTSASGIDADTEQMHYTLKGFAAPPEAEGVVVVECEARCVASKTIVVPNALGKHVNKTALYSVECDLDFCGGEPNLSVERNSEGLYTLDVAPIRSGVFKGMIHFTTPEGHALWYALEVRVARPTASRVEWKSSQDASGMDVYDARESPRMSAEQETLSLQTQTHNAVTCLITMRNPLKKPAVFRVRCEGHGLIGAPTLTLPAGKSGTYEVTYSPLFVGSSSGSVSFTHPNLGEFWYPISLTAVEAPLVEVPELKTSLGAPPVEHRLKFQNPTDDTIEVEVTSSNDLNFQVVTPATKKLTIKPFEKGRVVVKFLPSRLETIQSAVITAHSATGGTWRWRLTGSAKEPDDNNIQTTRIFVTLGQSGSHAVRFRNPFEHALAVTAKLEWEGSNNAEDSSSNGHFELLLNKLKTEKGMVVGANTAVDVPFRFKPGSMNRSDAVLVVTSAPRQNVPQLTWRFPIIGEAEAPFSGHTHVMHGKARRRYEMGMTVILKHMQEGTSGISSKIENQIGVPFQFEIAGPGNEREHLKKALQVTPLSTTIKNSEVRFHVSLRPVREITCVVDLIITLKSGGRWRFPIRIDAEAPEVDGVIRVEAHVGHPRVALFHLPNPDVVQTHFQAFFTSDSPSAFSVSPDNGTMEAGTPVVYDHAGTSVASNASPGAVGVTHNRRRFDLCGEAVEDGPGAEFRIGYAPVEYGTDLVGRLQIVTKDNTWNYEVLGTTPVYIKPNAPAKVVTKISKATEERLKEAQERNAKIGNIVLKNTKPENYTSRKMLSRQTR